jgi:excinuclease ABC subunit B
MKKAMDTTLERREIQDKYNKKHGIIPKTVIRKLDSNLKVEDVGELYNKGKKTEKMPARERKKLLDVLNAKMKQAAKMLEFEEAARLRDEIAKIKKL